LTAPGNWIYSTTEKKDIRIECPNFTEHLEIDNSGIITIHQGCKIRTKTATMSHPFATKFLQHYAPSSNLSILKLYEPTQEKYKINLTEATHEIWVTDHSNVEATLDDIIEKVRQIKDRRVRDRKITAYNAVTCSIGILGTLIVISI